MDDDRWMRGVFFEASLKVGGDVIRELQHSGKQREKDWLIFVLFGKLKAYTLSTIKTLITVKVCEWLIPNLHKTHYDNRLSTHTTTGQLNWLILVFTQVIFVHLTSFGIIQSYASSIIMTTLKSLLILLFPLYFYHLNMQTRYITSIILDITIAVCASYCRINCGF